MNKPELLSPAGDLEKLKTAFRYGADACYMGIKSMSMRVRENEMSNEDLEEALRLKNELGKKIYLTMNIHAHESRLNFLEKEIEYLKKLHKKKLDPDGILVSDVGIVMILKKECPWIPIHISTQANILNSAGIEFWANQGAERVVLGREVSLRELKQIRRELSKKGIEVELESFVHGAMCMAYSGRCLLSSFMASRDANEGMCAHCCRWKYKVHIEEEMRPGEYIPIEEDDTGTHLMSSKDMCMIEHLKDLVESGLDSLKIEGRHKTPYYVAIATRAYREALDLAMEGKPPTPEILELIESINTRGYFTGFWYDKPGAEGQNYEDRSNYNDQFCFAGIIRKVDGKNVTMEIRNRLEKGDKLDIIAPEKTIPITLSNFKDAKTGEDIDVAHAGQGFSIVFEVPEKVEEGFIVRKKL
ncbi:U32 family peptidase C-terminal domain-containing protein [Patescibacteria group bacterium]|nr:U32 family peptidase C-terminal domain-containing protein [Patescibacteria group bacterium]MBU1683127.1 U32 family peptidase C-terminal domain-containing protein [Patescibacteria group bacterium]